MRKLLISAISSTHIYILLRNKFRLFQVSKAILRVNKQRTAFFVVVVAIPKIQKNRGILGVYCMPFFTIFFHGELIYIAPPHTTHQYGDPPYTAHALLNPASLTVHHREPPNSPRSPPLTPASPHRVAPNTESFRWRLGTRWRCVADFAMTMRRYRRGTEHGARSMADSRCSRKSTV